MSRDEDEVALEDDHPGVYDRGVNVETDEQFLQIFEERVAKAGDRRRSSDLHPVSHQDVDRRAI